MRCTTITEAGLAALGEVLGLWTIAFIEGITSRLAFRLCLAEIGLLALQSCLLS